VPLGYHCYLIDSQQSPGAAANVTVSWCCCLAGDTGTVIQSNIVVVKYE
jgi:hypothetical protein